jgi:hypothetical protein
MMKQFFNFLTEKLDSSNMQFHYLRVGNTRPLFEKLEETTGEIEELKWIQHETDSFLSYFFGSTYSEYEGAVVNLDLNDDKVGSVRKDFWENFVFKTREQPIPLVIIIPRSDRLGSLSKSQAYEALSLIRITDRPFTLLEYNDSVQVEVVQWLSDICSLVHRKERIEKEK